MERRPHGENGYSTSRKLPDWITKKLGTGDQSNGRSTEEHEEAVRQEKKKSSRTEGLGLKAQRVKQ